MSDWYCHENGRTYGPYSEEQMRGILSAGYITRDALVFCAESADRGWISVKNSGIMPPQAFDSSLSPEPPPLPRRRRSRAEKNGTGNNEKLWSSLYTGAWILVCILFAVAGTFFYMALSGGGSALSGPLTAATEAEFDRALYNRDTDPTVDPANRFDGNGVSAAGPGGVIGAIEKPADPSTVTLSFIGDCALGDIERDNQWGSFTSYYNQYGPYYFFEKVKHVFDRSDLTIANCEGVFTDSRNKTDKETHDEKFWVRGRQEYANIFGLGGVDLVNLANNHTMDYGLQGYNDTIAALNLANVGYFGNAQVAVKQIKSLRIGFFGFTLGKTDRNGIKRMIQTLQERGCEVIVATFHGGEENSYQPTQRQKDIARLAVDMGADIVIQHHTHVLQGTEYYKDKPIAYSLGNFVFGPNRNPKDKRSIIFQVIIEGTNDNLKFRQNIIPVYISGSPNFNNFQPVVSFW